MTEDKKVILLIDFILRIEHFDLYWYTILDPMITVFKHIGRYSIDDSEAPLHYDIYCNDFRLCIKTN